MKRVLVSQRVDDYPDRNERRVAPGQRLEVAYDNGMFEVFL